MFCQFNQCEFINIILGGILVGIISSFLFVFLTDYFKNRKFNKQYKHLVSDKNNFDWDSYPMLKDDGRIIDINTKQAEATVYLGKGLINITLRHQSRKWHGQVSMSDFGFGTLFFKYENEYEYGKRDCIIGSYTENGVQYDYIFLIPTNNRIYQISNLGNNNFEPVYDYGNEVLIRQSKSR
jgi:hypothetical protein